MFISAKTDRGLFIPIVFGLMLLLTPYLVFAAPPPPGTLIPCGFDLDSDNIVKDPDGYVWVVGTHEECYFNDVILIAQSVIEFLIFKIAIPIAAIMFAYAGFLYVTNRGNESQVTRAHDVFLNVLIGIVIALAAWIVVKFIVTFFLGTGSVFNLLGP